MMNDPLQSDASTVFTDSLEYRTTNLENTGRAGDFKNEQ